MKRSLALLAIGACASTAASPPTVPAPRQAAAPADAAPPVDPRLLELSARHDASALADSDGVPASPPDGVVLDDPQAADPIALANAKAVLVWPASDGAIAAFAPILEALSPDTEVFVAARHGDQLAWIRARALEQTRCVAWLVATGASVADVARATGPEAELDSYVLEQDPRVCGGSWQLRVEALRTGGGSLYVRSDAGGAAACARLAFDANGLAVREGAGDVPQLAFDVRTSDSELDVEPALHADGLVSCKAQLAVDTEQPDRLETGYTYAYPMSTGIRARAEVFYSEAACLGAEPPPEAPSCLRQLLAATSSRADGVVDRVAPIAAKHGSLYRASDGCKAIRFGTTKLHEPGRVGTVDTFYDGLSIREETTSDSEEVCWNGGCAAVDDREIGDTILPVVQRSGDHVLVAGEPWYLTRKACLKASPAAR